MSFDDRYLPIRVVVLRPLNDARCESAIASSDRVAILATISTEPSSIRSLVALGPDVAVVDLRTCELTEVSAMLRRIHGACGRTKIVALGNPGDEAMAHQALKGGAAACLTRATDPLSVLRAVENASRGRLHPGSTTQQAVRSAREDATEES